MSGLRSALGSAAIAVLGLGFGLWFAMVPAEHRRKDLKTLPGSHTVKTEALMVQMLKDAAESKDNLARDLKGPFK
ncbi:ubiquinol-cytochrome-c reductase complex assembly factor 3 [Betta splendens]|uniref:Ubiquinol-cytochrome-c reductase complex assembly factor 3 n=1 Tax=Betta splendens TaxID=158456 RepID=A0A6P7L3J0_BETSP|nr:ubiquinol-cytochrome-c reductase complex assembly factor 3 [Betta splendens]